MNSQPYKQYLGDSVYADFDGNYITLTTENGYGPSNTIHLEPSVFDALNRYQGWLKEVLEQQQPKAGPATMEAGL
jgi:hypothetical protein